MQVTVKRLKALITEAIAASESYMKREQVRQEIQDRIVQGISSKAIKNDDDLKKYFETIEMALSALKMIPFDVYVKISKSDKKK